MELLCQHKRGELAGMPAASFQGAADPTPGGTIEVTRSSPASVGDPRICLSASASCRSYRHAPHIGGEEKCWGEGLLAVYLPEHLCDAFQVCAWLVYLCVRWGVGFLLQFHGSPMCAPGARRCLFLSICVPMCRCIYVC